MTSLAASIGINSVDTDLALPFGKGTKDKLGSYSGAARRSFQAKGLRRSAVSRRQNAGTAEMTSLECPAGYLLFGNFMKKASLGATETLVSQICLGTMTFGTQTAREDAWRQLDMAVDHGINFVDTAEMYPVNPLSKETAGITEHIIGEWLARTGRRADIVLATKISGFGQKIVRDGEKIDAKSVNVAIDGSLKRMGTDYIDLYQLHWPNRGSYMFRQNWRFDPTGQDRDETKQNMEEVLAALGDLVSAGKIRHVGLSNESCWGTSEWLRIARRDARPEICSLQNEYSLLCRLFDTDLAEMSHHERIGLLAYSPLAAGLLTGKYMHQRVPAGSRMTHQKDLGGRVTSRVWPAIDAYLDIAEKHGIDPAHMALAWCLTRPFMTAIIIGATTCGQLAHALEAAEVKLPSACIREIDAAHRRYPMPY